MDGFDYMPALGALGAGESQEGGGTAWEGTVTAGPTADGVITGSASIDVGGKGGGRHPQTSAAGAGGKSGLPDWRTLAAIGGVLALGGLAYWVYKTKFAKKGPKKRRGRRRR